MLLPTHAVATTESIHLELIKGECVNRGLKLMSWPTSPKSQPPALPRHLTWVSDERTKHVNLTKVPITRNEWKLRTYPCGLKLNTGTHIQQVQEWAALFPMNTARRALESILNSPGHSRMCAKTTPWLAGSALSGLVQHQVMQRTPEEGINIAWELCEGLSDIVSFREGTWSFIDQHDWSLHIHVLTKVRHRDDQACVSQLDQIFGRGRWRNIWTHYYIFYLEDRLSYQLTQGKSRRITLIDFTRPFFNNKVRIHSRRRVAIRTQTYSTWSHVEYQVFRSPRLLIYGAHFFVQWYHCTGNKATIRLSI